MEKNLSLFVIFYTKINDDYNLYKNSFFFLPSHQSVYTFMSYVRQKANNATRWLTYLFFSIQHIYTLCNQFQSEGQSQDHKLLK